VLIELRFGRLGQFAGNKSKQAKLTKLA
jgi:hypothetical protein